MHIGIPSLAVLSLGVFLSAKPISAAEVFDQTNLVSDGFVPALNTDPDLVNAWGISSGPSTPFWISDNGTGLSTLYNGSGVKQPLVVTIPPSGSAPTGQAFNSGGSAFNSSLFLFATENGTVASWAPANGTNAVTAVDNSGIGAVYKGLALSGTGSSARLYATNFHNGTVDAFDGNFASILPGTFTDPTLPAGYAPFNVQNIGGNLYVTYALQDATKHDDVAGPGHGFVDVFDSNGSFVKRLISQGALNSPWGLDIAPSSFGALAGALLVGNFGDGTINAYDPNTGAFLGTLRDNHGNPITIGGLWGLINGNGTNAGDPNKVYFTAGPDDEAHGLFGSLQVSAVPVPGTLGLLLSGIGALAATAAARRKADMA